MTRPRRDQTALAGLLLAWGAGAVVAQSILVRETTVLFYAGEISWGIVLGAWLAGVGAGALTGGKLARRTDRPGVWLSSVAAVFAVAGPIGIVLVRCARGWLDVGAGQYVPMGAMAGLSVLLVSPFGLLIGVGFPLACSAARRDDEAARIGWVYLVESAGSLIGGVAFTFLLAGRVGPTIASAGCGLLLSGSAVWAGIALRDGPRYKGWAALALATAGCVLTGAMLVWGARLERWSVLRRWRSFAPGMTLRGTIDSRYQNLALGCRDGQFELYANGRPTATFPDPTALRWLGQVAMCEHPDPRRVLLLGGALDGMLPEVLTHRCVERVDCVELDPAALRLCRLHLPDRDRRALDDSRVKVVHEDPRRFVRRAAGPYDLVIGRFGPPSSALTARFYTVEFYRSLARLMSPNGVLVFETTTSPAELRPESAACTGAIHDTLERVFGEVIVGWGPSPPVLACRRAGVLTTEAEVLSERLSTRGVPGEHFAAADFLMNDRLDEMQIAKRRAELAAVAAPAANTDLHPRIYLLWLQRWEQQMIRRAARGMERPDAVSPLGQRTPFAWLSRIPAPRVAAVALVGVSIGFGWRRVRHGRARGLGGGAVLCSIASTGLTAMAVEIVVLFTYQSLIGYVYEQIGAVIGLFMLGLVLGSAWMGRVLTRKQPGRGWLIGLDLCLAGLVVPAPLLLVAAGRWGPDVSVTLAAYGLTALTGVLGGAAFPLAGRLHALLDGRPNRAAAAVDAADHAGACIGALMTGVVLVPAVGIWATCLVLAGLKVVSAVALTAWAQTPPDRAR